jgi:hypothetical protein
VKSLRTSFSVNSRASRAPWRAYRGPAPRYAAGAPSPPPSAFPAADTPPGRIEVCKSDLQCFSRRSSRRNVRISGGERDGGG